MMKRGGAPVAKLLTRDEARRIAINIAKLPETHRQCQVSQLGSFSRINDFAHLVFAPLTPKKCRSRPRYSGSMRVNHIRAPHAEQTGCITGSGVRLLLLVALARSGSVSG